MAFFNLAQLSHQAIIFTIADDRLVDNVIAVIMEPDFLAQFFESRLER
jgi:hypothetical protein